MEDLEYVVIVASFAVGISLGMLVGGTIENNNQKNLLIEKGIAEYQINPKTGEIKFVKFKRHSRNCS